jgi:hypothetical protein
MASVIVGDADISLRHVTRQHPEQLVRGLLTDGMAGLPMDVVGWLDTQVTALERRLDKALLLKWAGEPRVLHTEITLDLPQDMAYRVHEYQALLLMALRGEDPKQPLPPIESVVVVLRGRKEPLPAKGELRTGWPESEWSGSRFRIEAVYQRRIEELLARQSPLWLIFAPLARDATATAMSRVLEMLRAQVPQAGERGELFTALLVMADLDPWGHNLREEIVAMIQRNEEDRFIFESRTLREVFEKGLAEGLGKGLEQGLEQGRQQAIEAMLHRLFRNRIGRDLTAAEQTALAKRAHELGPEQAMDVAGGLSGDELITWLLGSNGSNRQ